MPFYALCEMISNVGLIVYMPNTQETAHNFVTQSYEFYLSLNILHNGCHFIFVGNICEHIYILWSDFCASKLYVSLVHMGWIQQFIPFCLGTHVNLCIAFDFFSFPYLFFFNKITS
ncbi:hypothetical protein ACJX0J_012660, partial [Zea mays]